MESADLRSVAIPLLLFAAAPSAQATVSITPVREDGTAISNLNGSFRYYPVSTISGLAGYGTTFFLDTSDPSVTPNLIDVTKDQTQLLTSRTDLMIFSVSSSATVTAPTGSQRTVMTVLASSASAGSHLVPIAFVQYPTFQTGGGSACSATGSCQGNAGINDSSGNPYLLGVQYTPQTTIQIGIYPKDVCSVFFQKYGGVADGCTGSDVNASGTASVMRLTFAVNTAADSTSVPPETGASDSATVSLAFVDDPLTITACPSTTDIYFPGDSEIEFNANASTNTFTLSVPTGMAPIAKVVAVANENPTAASLTANYSAANSVYGVLDTGAEWGKIGGFTNTTNGTDHAYNLGYMVRDASGMLITNSCTLSNVRTASIRGFLARSNCFIATAAFRSIEASPVAMLRQFRDDVLLVSEPGREFVRWYYRWSPEAAEWLMRHPLFRYPVLLALIPVEVIAWLFLHPAWMVIIAILNVFVLMRNFKGIAHES